LVDWFNYRRLLEPIGNIPPAEAETIASAAQENLLRQNPRLSRYSGPPHVRGVTAMPEMAASTRKATRRPGVSETAVRKPARLAMPV
jgi:hypothetical protein